MRYRMRHLAGATLIVTLSVMSQPARAQDCPNCVSDAYSESYAGPSTEAYTEPYSHTYSDAYTQSYPGEDCGDCNQGTAGDAGSCGQAGLDPNRQACGMKACQGFRPFTEDSQPDLFYNYYVPNNLGAAAAAYPAPYPTPNLIGHTYYTYQPLMPHEMLYTHQRTYHQFYDGGMGLNRTRVTWYRTPVRTALKDFKGSVGWFLGNLHR